MHERGDLPISGIRSHRSALLVRRRRRPVAVEFRLRVARELDTKIDELGEENVAAFVAEPVQGAAGVIIPPETYWPEIARICKARNILLVTDEVICGFGRLGEWFGYQYFGVEPDFAPIAKGLSSGYLPIGGVLVSDRIAEVLINDVGDFSHGFHLFRPSGLCRGGTGEPADHRGREAGGPRAGRYRFIFCNGLERTRRLTDLVGGGRQTSGSWALSQLTSDKASSNTVRAKRDGGQCACPQSCVGKRPRSARQPATACSLRHRWSSATTRSMRWGGLQRSRWMLPGRS